GSLGVDVATTIEVTLQDKEVTLILTNLYGPIFSSISLIGGLLLGRSSTSRQGVIPGVMDADYTGQVKIMAYALQPPVTIPKGSKIAQIIAFENLLPHRQQPRQPTERQRGHGSFGSKGHDVFFTKDMKDRPHKKVELQCGSHIITLEPLLDTGANISIVN
ncbi:POK9 protein, partial [Alaudala cheleensis]|nr:POK9 protein [Alaudala cheleensis]